MNLFMVMRSPLQMMMITPLQRGTAGAPRYHDVDSADGWFHLQTWPLMMMSPLQTGAAGISQMELPDIRMVDYISRLDREAKLTRVRLAPDKSRQQQMVFIAGVETLSSDDRYVERFHRKYFLQESKNGFNNQTSSIELLLYNGSTQLQL